MEWGGFEVSPVGLLVSSASKAVMRLGVRSKGVACMLSQRAEV